MDLVSNAYATALVLGALHSLEVDHMVAVSVFAGSEPRVSRAALFGTRWGLGHAAVVFVAGGILAWSGVDVPEAWLPVGEATVGVAMVLLGLWAIRSARNLHLHRPEDHGDHAHLHAHRAGMEGHAHAHDHHGHHHHSHGTRGRYSTVMGAIHGLAGTAPVLALLPVTLTDSLTSSLTYLAVFGAGTVASMTAFAAVTSMALNGARLNERGLRKTAMGISVAAIVVGLWWVLRVF